MVSLLGPVCRTRVTDVCALSSAQYVMEFTWISTKIVLMVLFAIEDPKSQDIDFKKGNV
jgi:hypothetical protein